MGSHFSVILVDNVVAPLLGNLIPAAVCYVFARRVRVCVTAWLVTGAVWVLADATSFAIMRAAFRPSFLTAFTGGTPDPIPLYVGIASNVALLLMFASAIWAGIFVFRHPKVWIRAVVGSAVGVFWFVAAMFIMCFLPLWLWKITSPFK